MSFLQLRRDHGFAKRSFNERKIKGGEIFIQSYENNNYYLDKEMTDMDDLSVPLTKEYILYNKDWEKVLVTKDYNDINTYIHSKQGTTPN